MRTLRSTVNVHRSEKGGSVLAQLHANLLFEDKVPQQGSKNERNIAMRWGKAAEQTQGGALRRQWLRKHSPDMATSPERPCGIDYSPCCKSLRLRQSVQFVFRLLLSLIKTCVLGSSIPQLFLGSSWESQNPHGFNPIRRQCQHF